MSEPDNKIPDGVSGTSPRSGRRKFALAPLAAGVLLGTLVALVGLLIVAIFNRRTGPPTISRADLAAAVKRWEDHGPSSYDMDLRIGGRQAGAVHIEVRLGKVTTMSRDGVVPEQRRTWEYWTVPEQFETIAQDFDSAERLGGFGAPPGTSTVIRAGFDPQLGYPRKYQRLVLGTELSMEWEVTRFTAID